MTCLAFVGGLAFAAGAVWMLRNSRRQSRMDEFMEQVSEFARRPRWW
jgi:Flp pilus assembly protein TadB